MLGVAEHTTWYMFTPEQLRAARALLGWSRDQLAEAAGVSAIAIKSFERGVSDPRISTMMRLRTAVERAGVVFVDADETLGPGVRLKSNAPR
jgi:transcriptional regulator with XRE-family HTH domain